MGEKFLYIDDSGQLSNNGTHEYFLYSGIFIENSDVISEIRRRLNGYAKSNGITGEFKGSELGGRHRIQIMKIARKTEGIHQFFVIEKKQFIK
ncbi:DUF3800 domain-containing protein [Staphylococcus cohnii]